MGIVSPGLPKQGWSATNFFSALGDASTCDLFNDEVRSALVEAAPILLEIVRENGITYDPFSRQHSESLTTKYAHSCQRLRNMADLLLIALWISTGSIIAQLTQLTLPLDHKPMTTTFTIRQCIVVLAVPPD